MITYEDIQTYVDEGKTAAEILATLQADFRHQRDIYATGGTQSDNLLHILSARFMVLHRTEDNTFAGPLVDYIKSIRDSTDAADIQKVSAIRLLLMTINVTNQQVFTSTDLPAAGMVELIIPIVGAVSPVADEAAVRADVYRVTGGPKYASLTVEDIEAVIQEKVDSDALAAKRGIINNGLEAEKTKYDDQVVIYNEGLAPHRDRYNVASSYLSIFDVTDKTEQEVQDYVDSIINSADGKDPNAVEDPEVI